MQTVVGVRFKKAGKIYYFDPGNLGIGEMDDVIVETARGVEYGQVVIGPREVDDDKIVSPLKTVQRKATAADMAKVEENRRKEKEGFAICEKKIAAHNLPMKLIEVEYDKIYDFKRKIYHNLHFYVL